MAIVTIKAENMQKGTTYKAKLTLSDADIALKDTVTNNMLTESTIVGKRMLVPFIATPLAGEVEKKMAEKEAMQNGQKPAAKEDKSNPAMLGAQKQQATTPAIQGQTLNVSDGDTNLLAKYRK